MRFLIFALLSFVSPLAHAFTLTQLGDPKSGHTLMVLGGIHGDEPGGYFAPALLAQYYTVTKGALWVVPNINQKSITRCRRGIHGDMNRKFATTDPKDPDYEIVMGIKELITKPNVDLILNLHDGHGFYRSTYRNDVFNPAAWGQSCVIDQTCISDTNATFGMLSDVAQKVSEKLNTTLLADHHLFGVKNTKTKKEDQAMQLSLTYYAINQGKPAFAIETSKNLHKTSDKVFYQLRAIEAFMDIMGIEYQRNFELTKHNVEEKLLEYGTLTINDHISFDLKDIKSVLHFVPLKEKSNTFKLSHPLADVVQRETHYEVYVGHLRVLSLYGQIFTMDDTLKNVQVRVDGMLQEVSLPSTIEVKEHFTIMAPKKYRVNVIGYSHETLKNENNLSLSYSDMIPRFSIDKPQRRFRVEFYDQERFCGMMIVYFST